MSNEGQMVSVIQAADFLGVNPITVRRMIKKGTIDAYRIGKNVVRIKMIDLQSFVNGRKIETFNINDIL